MMVKIYLLALVLTFSCLPLARCVFTTSPTRNFTIQGLNLTNPLVVLDGTATKFLVWTPYPGHLEIHSINGTKICSNDYNGTLQSIIWPINHPPIVSVPSIGQIAVIDENTCQPSSNYNLWNITKMVGESAYSMDFTSRDNRSILTVGSLTAVHQIDLNSSQLIKTFSAGENNTFATTSYQQIIYSKDFSYLYGMRLNATETRFSIKIWANINETKNPIHEINLPENAFPGPITTSKESDSMIFWALDPSDQKTKVYTFDNNGTLITKDVRPAGNVIAINDGNLFDVFGISNIATKSLDVINLNNGQTLQKLNLPVDEELQAGYYKNRVLILLAKAGRVLTYSYEDDILPPKPDDDIDQTTIWIIVICVVVGVIIISAAAFVIRKKKLSQKKSEVYGKLNDEV